MVVAMGKWGTLITQVRSAGELEIIRSLPGGPISVYLLEAITPPELTGGSVNNDFCLGFWMRESDKGCLELGICANEGRGSKCKGLGEKWLEYLLPAQSEV